MPLTQAESATWREYVHIEHAPIYHALTDGKEKFIWFVADGREQFFDLAADPTECRDVTHAQSKRARIALWRDRLIGVLRDRPEGFTNGERLVPERAYPAVLTTR